MSITNAKRLVFLDESFCSTGMRRDYGRAARGLRVFGEKPGGRWKTLSLIGAVRLGARPKLMTHVGAVNGAVFLRFVTRRLVPWLRRGDVVVMDNLNTHKMTKVRAAIEAAGAAPVYLPTYSPELNPIELWWADLKRHLRKLGADAGPELARAVRRLRASVSLDKIAAWFRHSASHLQFK